MVHRFVVLSCTRDLAPKSWWKSPRRQEPVTMIAPLLRRGLAISPVVNPLSETNSHHFENHTVCQSILSQRHAFRGSLRGDHSMTY